MVTGTSKTPTALLPSRRDSGGSCNPTTRGSHPALPAGIPPVLVGTKALGQSHTRPWNASGFSYFQ